MHLRFRDPRRSQVAPKYFIDMVAHPKFPGHVIVAQEQVKGGFITEGTADTEPVDLQEDWKTGRFLMG